MLKNIKISECYFSGFRFEDFTIIGNEIKKYYAENLLKEHECEVILVKMIFIED
jgi:hypothetical protein